jgi:RNA polymerase sigma-70 factor (ECF subfamily)
MSDHVAAFDEHRGALFSIAYRMLGNVADAEDIVQESFIRFQQAAHEEIRSPRAFLTTIVSRLCINHLQSARVKREEYVGQWLPEPIVTDPAADPFGVLRVDESISLAFLVLLERLTPIERAVFLLREVFDYEYSEIAATLSRSEANCRQIFRRARQHVEAGRPRFEPSEQAHDDLLQRFLHATDEGDLQALLGMLSRDVVLHADGGGVAPAVPNVVRGSGNVARGILGGLRKFVPADIVRRTFQINGGPGVVAYLDGKPFSVVGLQTSGGLIHAIYVVTNPAKLSHLPDAPR